MQDESLNGFQYLNNCEDVQSNLAICTAKTLHRKCETTIPRNETARPRSQSYIHVSVSDLYIPMIRLPILPGK